MMRRLFVAAVSFLVACSDQSASLSVEEGGAVATSHTEQALTGDNAGGKNLAGANLGGANLGGANLGGANLGGANLGGANLGGANLGGANLGGANLGGANLGGANLAGNNLGGANLGGANLGGANLGGANLGGANLGGANLGGANLAGTNLGGVQYGLAPNPYQNNAGTGSPTRKNVQQASNYANNTGINIHDLPTLPRLSGTTWSGGTKQVLSSPVEVTLDFTGPGGSTRPGVAGATLRNQLTGTFSAVYSAVASNSYSAQTSSAANGFIALTDDAIYAVTITSVKGPNRGKVNIVIDGVTVASDIDLYAATLSRQEIFSSVLTTRPAMALPDSHTIEVRNVGKKHASSTGYVVDVDTITMAISPGPIDVPAFSSTSGALLYTGEDLYHRSFAGTQLEDRSCVVMGLGSTAFGRLIYDNTNSGSTPAVTINAAIAKLPWGFSPAAGQAKTLDAWEVYVYGPRRYCVFVVVAPPDTTHDGMAGFIKAAFRWAAAPATTIQIGAIGGGQALKTYTGMMNAAKLMANTNLPNMAAETYIGGELAFISATTNNVSVNVDFSSWYRDSTGTRLVLGNVSNAPQYLEGAYVAYKTAAGNIGVMLVPGSKAARGTVSAPVLQNGKYNYYLTQPNGAASTIHDSGAEVARAYNDWLKYGGGYGLLVGLKPPTGSPAPTAPPLPKRCAGARAIVQSSEYAMLVGATLSRCVAPGAPCTPGELALAASFTTDGADPILAPVLKAKCDAAILADNTESTFVLASVDPYTGQQLFALGHSAVNVRLAATTPAYPMYTGPATPVAYQQYADNPPDTIDVSTTFEMPVMINGVLTMATNETVTVLGGTYVHLNDLPY